MPKSYKLSLAGICAGAGILLGTFYIANLRAQRVNALSLSAGATEINANWNSTLKDQASLARNTPLSRLGADQLQSTKSAKQGSGNSPQEIPLGLIADNHTLAALAAGTLILLIVLDRIVLWFKPRLLLRLPDEGLVIPIGWDKVLPLGSSILRYLKYRPRVLDAWIKDHKETIEKSFSSISTVYNRRVHLDLPVIIGTDRGPIKLTPEVLKAESKSSRIILVSGEGGIGKTSLALRIAVWALKGEISDQVVIPIMIEADLGKEESLLKRVKNTLTGLVEPHATSQISTLPTISESMVEALLKQNRLLLILDHASELSDESRRRLLPSSDDFPSSWAIVTSRREEKIGGKVFLHLKPQRLTANELHKFITDYLELKRGEKESLDLDSYLKAITRLRDITDNLRKDLAITVLLAKLYIEVILAGPQGAGGTVIPDSVPALMLAYVKLINEAIPENEQYPSELVVRALQIFAKESLGTLFRPQPVSRKDALGALQKAIDEMEGHAKAPEDSSGAARLALLNYITDRLGLVAKTPNGQFLSLALDPLADYLAAIGWLSDLAAGTPSDWNTFLDMTLPRPKTVDSSLASGFLNALYDSVDNAKSPKVLNAVVDESIIARISELASINKEEIAYAKEQRRIQRLVDDLAEPDLVIRLQALDEICMRGKAEAHVVESLAMVARSSDQETEVRHKAIITLGILGGDKASQSLILLLHADQLDQSLQSAVCGSLGVLFRNTKSDEVRQAVINNLEGFAARCEFTSIVKSKLQWHDTEKQILRAQGVSRGLQIAASSCLPVIGDGSGRKVPMLTIDSKLDNDELTLEVSLISPRVWMLPLPEAEFIEVVKIESNSYQIGSLSQPNENGRNRYADMYDGAACVDVEAKRHVKTPSYWISRYPITQRQWQVVARLPQSQSFANLLAEPSARLPETLWERYAEPGRLPVDSVLWTDCDEWMKRYNGWIASNWSSFSDKSAIPAMRFPSESRWEIACRAGSGAAFGFGDVIDSSWVNYDGRRDSMIPAKDPADALFRRQSTVVGACGFVNKWGLSDMHGQVWEWCGDFWHVDPMGEGWPSNGDAWLRQDPALKGSRQQKWRVLRGGSWYDGAEIVRSAHRNCRREINKNHTFGFRPCIVLRIPSL